MSGTVRTDWVDDQYVYGADMNALSQAALDAYVKPGSGIPATDLTTAVQTLLTAAGTAYQKAGSGIPAGDLAAAVQTLLTAAGTAYQKPVSGIPAADLQDRYQSVAPLFNVNLYGASPSNSASANNTAIAAAIAAMGTSPGTLKFGVGAYAYSTTITLNNQPGQGIAGDGSASTVLDFRGTGDAVRIYDKNTPHPLHSPNDAYGGSARGGHVTGLTIYGGNNSNTNINGLHIGDVYAPYISDVDIQSFNTTGSIGFFGEHFLGGSSERAFIQMSVEDCTTCYKFARNASNPATIASWSYSKYFLAFLAHNNQNGVVLTDGLHMDEVDMWIGGNTEVGASGSTNTGTVLTFGSSTGFALRFGGTLTVAVENNADYASGGPCHKDINILTGGSPVIQAIGVLQFNDAGGGAYVAGSATTALMKFMGRINCPSLGQNPTKLSATQGIISNAGVVAGAGVQVGTDILDANGNIILKLAPTAAAVNYLKFQNRAAGSNTIFIAPDGAGTNMNAGFHPKAAGYVSIYMDSGAGDAKIQAEGDDANVGLNLATQGTGVVKANNVQVATIVKRLGTVASSATPSINTDTVDQFNITALATAITSMTTNLTGTPTGGQRLIIRIKDNGTIRAITWGASFVSSGVATLLASTVANKTHLVGLIYDAAAAVWVCVAVDAVGY